MEVDSVFITGANRGIGLEFVRQIVKLPKPPRYVFATYRDRNTVEELNKIRDDNKKTQVLLIKMDVTKQDEIQAARKIVEDLVRESGLTLLINNAGAIKVEGFPNLTEDNLLFHFRTNTIGPIMVLQEFLPLLQRSADRSNADTRSVSRSAVVNISSLAGCITRSGVKSPMKLPVHGYKISKAALNMAMRAISSNMETSGILLVMMCPGWVKTDLGGESAELHLNESVSTILKTLPTLNDSHYGNFLSRDGETYEF